MAIVKISDSRGNSLSESLPQLFAAVFLRRQHKRRLSQHPVPLSNDEQLALIGSMNNLGFWSLDLKTSEVWANPQARNIFGFEQNAQLARSSFLRAIHEDDRGILLAAAAAAVENRSKTAEIELRVGGAGRAAQWVTVKLCVSSNAQNAAPRIMGSVVADHRCKRAGLESFALQERLTHLTRIALLGELSGALAHELQQPLTAILANAQAALLLANTSPVDTGELKDILREIVSDDKHAGQLITSLRALLIQTETQMQRLDMGKLVEEVLILARGTLMERNVQVHTRLDEGAVPAIRGNQVELKQVLLNLILNACDAMIVNPARDRQIEIVISHTDVLLQVSVLDCGVGIEAQQMQRVFEPFFTTKENGLGLGLAISRSIVRAHGGRLWASGRQDRGMAFHFTLPIAEQVLECPS